MSRKIDLVSGNTLQYERRYVYDKIDAEIQRYIPQLLPNKIIRVGPLVKSLIVYFRLLRCGLGMVLVIYRYVIVDHIVMKIMMIVFVRFLYERRRMVLMVRKFHRFRPRSVVLVSGSYFETRILRLVPIAAVIFVRRRFVGIRDLRDEIRMKDLVRRTFEG